MEGQPPRDRLVQVVDDRDSWISHNVQLPDGRRTLGAEPMGDNNRAYRFAQIAQDLLRIPFSEMRVLDLGCHEGLYALEFAQQGATVIGIEGRQDSVARAVFGASALGLDRVTFHEADGRDVTADTYGSFDCVLCSGILYHLDSRSLPNFTSELRRLCRGICIIDTMVAGGADTQIEADGSYTLANSIASIARTPCSPTGKPKPSRHWITSLAFGSHANP